MGLYKRKDSNVWWYRFSVKGKEYRGSTGTDNKLDAEAFEIDRKRKVRDSRNVISTHVSGSILLEDTWAAFRSIAPAKMKRIPAAKRWEAKRKIWENFLEFIQTYNSFKTISEITTDSILDYVTHIKQFGKWSKDGDRKPLATTTQCEYIILVKQVFTFLEKSGNIEYDHFKDVALPKVTREGRETFTEEELKQINKYLSEDAPDPDILGPIFFVGINSGLRRGDICTLSGEHVDLNKKVIAKKLNKTGETVTIPISSSLWDFLQNYKIKKDTPLFPVLFNTYNNVPNSITFKFKQMLKNLDIDNQSNVKGRTRKVSRKDIHSLRHTFCFLHAMKLTPLPVLQSMVGHMSKEMTQQYISHANEQAKKVAQTIMDDFDFTKFG